MKFEKDFDFESANAQFNKEEIDREFQSKLKLKGHFYYKFILFFLFYSLDFLWSLCLRPDFLIVSTKIQTTVEPTPTLKAWFCGLGHDSVPSLPTDEKAEKSEKAVNGEDKGDSGVETQNSEGNADEECDPLGPNCYYDKSKSFFDNISCDDTRSFQKLSPPLSLCCEQ